MSFHIDRSQSCIFIELTGVLTEWDIGTAVQSLWNHPEFDPAFDRFADASTVSAVATHRKFVVALATDERSLRSTGRVALIASSEMAAGFEHIFAPNAGELKCRAFTSRQEALDWLGVKSPQMAASA